MGCGGMLIGAVGTSPWVCVRGKMNLNLKEVRGRAMVVVGLWTAVSVMLGGKAADVCWVSCLARWVLLRFGTCCGWGFELRVGIRRVETLMVERGVLKRW